MSIESSRCYTKAVDYLSRRDHSRKELMTKLLRHDFEKEDINNVLDLLQEKNYINEEEYLRVAVRSYGNRNYSPRKILEKLRTNGINVEQSEIQSIFEREGIDSNEAIDSNVRKIFRSLSHKEISDYEIDTKVTSRLFAKGFQIDEIRKSIARVRELDS